ncbi:MAG: ATP-binding protein, partial [Syntrophothermus sp.]
MQYLLSLSVIIQIISFIISVRNVRISRWKRLWAGVSAAVLLYTIHETYLLLEQLLSTKDIYYSPFEVFIDLAISILILFSINKLSVYLRSIVNEEKLLQESLALSSLVVDQIPSVIWTMDMDLKFTSSRGSGLAKLGLKPDQVLGMSVYEYFGSHDVSRHEIAVHIEALKGKSGNFEIPIGTGIWVAKVDPLRDKTGAITGIIGLAVDISESKESEKNLRNSEERFRSIVNSIPNGMYFYNLDPDGTLRFAGANPSADEMMNIKHSELVGLAIEEAFPNLINTLVPRMYSQIASGEIGYQFFEIPYKDERFSGFYEVHAFQTTPNSLAVFFSDITERKNTEIELEKYREHLEILVTERTSQLEEAIKAAEQATKIKSEFMANMSHEIRTPMNAIIGLTSSALKTNLDTRQRDYLEKIEKSSISLLRIINDILDFSKIEAGMLKLEKVEFVFEDILENISNIISARAVKKGLKFLFRVDPEVPYNLTGDPLRLEQILINLCGNAVKFTERGEIVVSVDVIEKEDKKVRIQFSVKDTGIGIREEDKEKLFEKFSQTDASITRKFGGTGLGLSITKDLLKLMGGQIEVESQPGMGSTFTFVLDFEYDPAAGTHSQSRSNNSNDLTEVYDRLESIRGAHILLVEDDEINQQVAIELLESAGMIVETASNGLIAVEKIKKTEENNRFDMVLMD